MLKIAAIIGLSLVVIFLGIQIFSFIHQVHRLNGAYVTAEAALTKAKNEETNLQQEQQYLANPLNLEKALRSRFNYVKPGERMIVITPSATSSASTTAPIGATTTGN